MFLFYLMPFFDVRIFGYPLLDLSVFIAVPCLLFLKRSEVRSNNIALFFLMLLLFSSSLLNLLIDFSSLFQVFPIIKFVFLIAFLFLAKGYFALKIDSIDVAIKKALFITISFSILNVILYIAGFDIFENGIFNVPKPLGYNLSGVRFCGICSEPAHLSILTGSILFYLIARNKCSIWNLIFASIFIVSTLSIVGIVFLIFNLCYYYMRVFTLKKMVLLILAFAFLTGVALSIPQIRDRLLIFNNGGDSSSANRLIQSWQIAFNAPLYGFGLIDRSDQIVEIVTKANIQTYENYYINNIFAVVYFAGGPFTLLVFLFFLMGNCKYNLWGMLFSFLLCLASGSFNSSITWIQLILIFIAFNNLPKLRKHNLFAKTQNLIANSIV